MPSVLDTAERLEEVDGHNLPSVHPRFWRPWAPFLRRSQAQRSPQTLRFCVMPHPQTRETLMELVARQHPFLYSQAGSGL
jgi:hypothetical protein